MTQGDCFRHLSPFRTRTITLWQDWAIIQACPEETCLRDINSVSPKVFMMFVILGHPILIDFIVLWVTLNRYTPDCPFIKGDISLIFLVITTLEYGESRPVYCRYSFLTTHPIFDNIGGVEYHTLSEMVQSVQQLTTASSMYNRDNKHCRPKDFYCIWILEKTSFSRSWEVQLSRTV